MSQSDTFLLDFILLNCLRCVYKCSNRPTRPRHVVDRRDRVRSGRESQSLRPIFFPLSRRMDEMKLCARQSLLFTETSLVPWPWVAAESLSRRRRRLDLLRSWSFPRASRGGLAPRDLLVAMQCSGGGRDGSHCGESQGLSTVPSFP